MNLVEINTEKNHIVKKHNILIDKARYSLDEVAIKVLSILICMVKKDDEAFKKYYLDINDIKKWTKTNHKDNDYFVGIAKSLMSRPFELDRQFFNWVSKVKLIEHSSVLEFDIHEDLKPYLLQLKENYLSYDINDILILKSSYVIRFYELIFKEWKQYKTYNKNAKSFSFMLKINDLIELFQIPESYKYYDIKRRIIDKAQQEFKDKTNIRFAYKEIKIGKKVHELKITVIDNNKGSNDFLNSEASFVKYVKKTYKGGWIDGTPYFPPFYENENGDEFCINGDKNLYIRKFINETKRDIIELTGNQALAQWTQIYNEVKANPSLLIPK